MNDEKNIENFEEDEAIDQNETVQFVNTGIELPEAVEEAMNARFEALERAMDVEMQKAADENQKIVEAYQSVAADEANLTAGMPVMDDPQAEAADLSEPMPPLGPLSLEEAQASIESIVFLAEKPLSLEKIYNLLSPENEEGERPTSFSIFQEAYSELKKRYASPTHGFEIAEVAGGLQFRTKPHLAQFTQKLAKIQIQRLSAGAMETMTIVAYKQPVLKEDIDKIRGVDSSYFIRGLLDRNLIEMSGRSELPGRPILYTTTQQFLQLFGLNSVKDLPPLHEIEGMVPDSQVGEEDPRIKEMRKLVQDMKSDKTRIDYDPREDERILKEMKENISGIAVSTPYLEEQKAAEKLANEHSHGA